MFLKRGIAYTIVFLFLVEIIIEERPRRFMKFFTSKKRRGKEFLDLFGRNFYWCQPFLLFKCMMQSSPQVFFTHTGVIANTAGNSDSEVDLLRTFCMKNHQPRTNNYTLLDSSDKCLCVDDLPDQLTTRWLSMSTATTQTSSTAIKCPR